MTDIHDPVDRLMVEVKKMLKAEVRELQQEVVELKEAAVEAQAQIEELEARPDGAALLPEFEEAIQRGHDSARHLGSWNLCPHPVCLGLERWVHARKKDDGG